MPTIGEVYNPLIEARNDQKLFDERLRLVGEMICTHNPDKCKSVENGIEMAKINLNYYCQYFNDQTALETKQAMGFGNHWVSLGGHVVNGAYKEELLK